MKRIQLLIAMVIVTHLPLSCGSDCESYCCGISEKHSKIISLASSINAYENKPAVVITIWETELIDNGNIASVHSSERPFSFIHSANACDPAPPIPTQKIESIVITSEDTIYASNQVFTPGSDVTHLFWIPYHNNDIEGFINRQNEDVQLFGTWETFLLFQLKQPPDSTINQRMHFTFDFDDSSTIAITTDPLLVTVY